MEWFNFIFDPPWQLFVLTKECLDFHTNSATEDAQNLCEWIFIHQFGKHREWFLSFSRCREWFFYEGGGPPFAMHFRIYIVRAFCHE